MFSFVYNGIDFAHKRDIPTLPTEDYFKHLHPFCEIIYFVSGNVDYTVESETRRLSEGDIILIPPGKLHYATVDSSVPYERYVLKFSDAVIPEYIRRKYSSGTVFYADRKKYGMTFGQLDAYHKKFNREEAYTLFMCEAVKLLVMLFSEPAISPSVKRSEFIERIVGFIDENIHSKISMQTLTDKFHYSKSFLNTEFRKQMKIPLMQYVRYKKVIVAHQLILNGMKKSDAAEAVGFEDYSTFFRTYRKYIVNDFSIDGD